MRIRWREAPTENDARYVAYWDSDKNAFGAPAAEIILTWFGYDAYVYGRHLNSARGYILLPSAKRAVERELFKILAQTSRVLGEARRAGNPQEKQLLETLKDVMDQATADSNGYLHHGFIGAYEDAIDTLENYGIVREIHDSEGTGMYEYCEKKETGNK